MTDSDPILSTDFARVTIQFLWHGIWVEDNSTHTHKIYRRPKVCVCVYFSNIYTSAIVFSA